MKSIAFPLYMLIHLQSYAQDTDQQSWLSISPAIDTKSGQHGDP
ncbi:MAG TPA: hypothetical protein PLA69_07765 [Flavobacterium sp.]|nr:hypothetical protein [Flavobacterium sp.]